MNKDALLCGRPMTTDDGEAGELVVGLRNRINRAVELLADVQPPYGKDVPQDPEMRAMGKDLDIAKRALDCLAGGEFATVEDTIKWAQGALDDIEGPKDRPVLPQKADLKEAMRRAKAGLGILPDVAEPIPNPIIRDGVAYPQEEPICPGEAVPITKMFEGIGNQ